MCVILGMVIDAIVHTRGHDQSCRDAHGSIHASEQRHSQLLGSGFDTS